MAQYLNVRKKMSALKIFLISIIMLITFVINVAILNISMLPVMFLSLCFSLFLSIFLMIKVMNYKADPK